MFSLAAWFVGIARELDRRNRLLTRVSAVLLLSVPVLVAAALVDQRTVMGMNPWIKPLKFTVSFSMYFLTLGWLLAYLPRSSRAVRTIGTVTAAMVLLEVPTLDLQAARGVMSHFNYSTLFDSTLYIGMGVAAFTQMAMLSWALLLFCTQPVDLPRPYLYGIRAGIAGMLLGFLPGIAMVAFNHHAVGALDGGAGLPVLNWSIQAGDLRIAHFLGLHALQVLPLAGYLLSPARAPVAPQKSTGLFTAIASGYLFAILAAFAQALAGQPLVALG